MFHGGIEPPPSHRDCTSIVRVSQYRYTTINYMYLTLNMMESIVYRILTILRLKKQHEKIDLSGLEYDDFDIYTPMDDGEKGIVIKVYDGDTVTIGFRKYGSNKNTRISCRINGIDTPELRGSSENEKSLALEAKDRLYKAVMGKSVTVMSPKSEKYGRLLCDLKTDEIDSISKYMLDDPRICKEYDGGKKVEWD